MIKACNNPFNSRQVEAVPYYGESVDTICTRFAQMNCRGAIVGPHGNGKTTLLHELISQLKTADRNICHIFLNDKKSLSLPQLLKIVSKKHYNTILIIDGAEQLNLPAWKAIEYTSRKNFSGLLITTHTQGMLETLTECNTSIETFCRIVDTILNSKNSIDQNILKTIYNKHKGNIRNCLSELYGIYAEQ